MIRAMEKDILKTLSYFHHFNTPLTLHYIHIFYPKAISVSLLDKYLENLCSKKLVDKDYIDSDLYYTLGGMQEIRSYTVAKGLAKQKLLIVRTYLEVLKIMPSIDFIGISGSLSMDNAKEDDDIDLCIISKPHRMWTSRITAIVLAYSMGLKRKRGTKSDKDKVCLNLFFDGREINIPREKQNAFVGHELLQMKVILDKNNTYQRFLHENRWVLRYFPNARSYYPFSPTKKLVRKSDWLMRKIGDMLEGIFKHIQLYCIGKHVTTERIYPNQLWFFPRDAETDVIDLL